MRAGSGEEDCAASWLQEVGAQEGGDRTIPEEGSPPALSPPSQPGKVNGAASACSSDLLRATIAASCCCSPKQLAAKSATTANSMMVGMQRNRPLFVMGAIFAADGGVGRGWSGRN